jgi:hypothetical protein
MKKQNYRLKHKLIVSFVLASFAITSFSPFFSNNVSAMSLNFEEKLPTKSKAAPSKEEVAKTMSNMPIQFEENRGQFDKKVRFASRRANSTVFLTATEAVMTHKVSEKKNFALKMKLVNGNKDAKSFGSEEKVSKSNYFRGNDASKWQTDVSTFGRANYEEVYKGIDIAWYGNAENELEYDFIVKPNADHRQIELKFSGSKRLKIADNGDLLIETKAGTITQRKPYTYQTSNGEKQEVESRYELVGKNKIKFSVGEYDKSRDLVIDPTLVSFSTYLGGTGTEVFIQSEIDSNRNVYVTGTTLSNTFPTTFGVFDTTANGDYDFFVSKINTQNNSLVFSTYIGTATTDQATDIKIGTDNTIYILGHTSSFTFPIPTNSGYDLTNNGSSDVVVIRLSQSGNVILNGSFLGGANVEFAYQLDIDNAGNIYVSGQTDSANFPTTLNAFDRTFSSTTPNTRDCFLAKFTPNLSSLIFSTYIGGVGNEAIGDIAFDSFGNPVIVGSTGSSDFPITQNAMDTTFVSGEAFILKLDSLGTSLNYSSFIGGTGVEHIDDINFDTDGSIFLTGFTTSQEFPITNDAFDSIIEGYDGFIMKLNSDMNSILFASFIGGNQTDYGVAAKYNQNNIYIVGNTTSTNLTTTRNALDRTFNGSTDTFLVILDKNTFQRTYSTYLGGTNSEYEENVLIDNDGNVYVTERTSSNNMPIGQTSLDNSHNGSLDAYVIKLSISNTADYDFDADGKSDVAVYRNGMWHVNQSLWGYKAQPFGLATDTPVPADYDGDGKTDYAVFRPSDVAGQPDFYVMKSSTNTVSGVAWGSVGDTPVPADYDGDGKVDFGVYRQGTDGDFYVNHQAGTSRHYRYGVMGDKPVVADYDGDGKADFAVFRPSDGTWYVNNSSTNTFNYSAWGIGTDKIVPADYDGDGKTDLAVYHESDGMWYINQSSNGQMKAQQWGISTDKPVPGDYDGDGKTDVAVYRDGQWLILQSSNNSPNLANQFGISTDMPIENLAVR